MYLYLSSIYHVSILYIYICLPVTIPIIYLSSIYLSSINYLSFIYLFIYVSFINHLSLYREICHISTHLSIYFSIALYFLYQSIFSPSIIYVFYISIITHQSWWVSSTHKVSMYTTAYNLSIWEGKAGGLEVQGHLWLHAKFETSLWYMRFLIRKIKLPFKKSNLWPYHRKHAKSPLPISLFCINSWS